MTEDQLAAVMSRTDAAAALIVGLLIEKGVVDRVEVVQALEKAIASAVPMANSPIVSSVFVHLKMLIDLSSLPSTTH